MFAVTEGLSLAISDPDAALSWVANGSAALDQIAQRELLEKDGNLDSAREWAQQSLRSNPLDARALTLLGLIAEGKGDEKSADTLMQIAGARTWRDREAQAWLFNRDVRRGDYSDALAHADAILRTTWKWDEYFPMLATFTVIPRAFEPLIAFLATSPPWRTWFLSRLSARLVDQARLIEIYGALDEQNNRRQERSCGHILIVSSRMEILSRLTKPGTTHYRPSKGRVRPIHSTAISTFRLMACHSIGTLKPFLKLKFKSCLQLMAADNRALLVEFSGARVSFANVRQLILLASGNYTFRGRVKAEELLTSRGLWWTIFCANSRAKTLAHTELVSGTIPWTDFTVKFEVPATDCSAQWLQLELPARIESEKRIAGQVWYQQLRIAPNPACTSAKQICCENVTPDFVFANTA